ncbi:GNAT family N-acetyltransferase [Brachybacterium endophyticum]|uniref:GNAT family N-acetyltransferase n=1 Tax=Brachybacterium endophyticum TaxID=2182385 RepID=A0A2U2RLZ9_9MICO|nr:GNAT family N-acetyltransferase [Brachybacterium endophyticum]PWH06861.1 GNAT family N-acetyltransferase [Brachybacterium endophyticum]
MSDDRTPTLHHAHLRDIDPRTVYLLAKLRQDVFTLEQHADDADLDGRELEDGTVLMWLEEAAAEPGGEAAAESAAGAADAEGVGRPIAHLRLLLDLDGTVHIGRVAVRRDRRRGGHGRRLMLAALEHARELAPSAEVHISAQAYLEAWYTSMGFETTGPLYVEAGIEHVPMRFLQPAR